MTRMTFRHETLGQQVLFGVGMARTNIAVEVERLGATAVMVIASESKAALAASLTQDFTVALHYSDVAPHVPIDKANAARSAATVAGIDLIVCIGGGSTTGLAKAIALTTGIPIVAVPTTYSGSEATNMWGLTEDARKTTGVDSVVLPKTVIYDAELTLTLPGELAVASGLNALAHCIDSLWAPRADPINQALAAEGIRALAAGLLAIKKDPAALAGHEQALYGTYLSAVAFASAGSGLHHKICHVLGGTYNMPHAQTHATVLPYVLAFNAPYAPDAERRVAEAFGSRTAVKGLNELRRKLDAPTALRDYGFAEADIPAAVALILEVVPPSNPHPVTTENLTELLTAAWAGTTPTAKKRELS